MSALATLLRWQPGKNDRLISVWRPGDSEPSILDHWIGPYHEITLTMSVTRPRWTLGQRGLAHDRQSSSRATNFCRMVSPYALVKLQVIYPRSF